MMNACNKLVAHQTDVGEHGDDMREVRDWKGSDQR